MSGADLFVYGTLLFDEVVELVAGRTFDAVEARLPGHACRYVRGQAYPGIHPAPGEDTPGKLLLGVDAHSLARIDAYEGTLYVRRRVEVVTDDGARHDARTYVLDARYRSLLTDTPWRRNAFADAHLDAYLDTLRGTRRDDEPPSAPGSRR